MNGLNRFRYILIIIFAVLTAGTTAYLALFPDIGKGIAVFLGLVILLMSSALMNLCIAGTSDDTRRIALLVFSLGVLILFTGAIFFILFSGKVSYILPAAESVEESQINTEEDISITHTNIETQSLEKSEPETEKLSPLPEPEESLSEDTIITPSAPIITNTIIIKDADPVIIDIPMANKEYSLEVPELLPESVDTEGDIEADIDISDIPISEEIITEKHEVSGSDDFFSGMTPEEIEFWSSFYIEGEDEIELADGLYYMDLYINERHVGDILVQISDSELAMSAAELSEYVEGTLTDEAEARIFFDRGEFIFLKDLNEAGVSSSYDLLGNEIYLTFSVADMPVQVLSISGASRRSVSRPIAGASLLEPAVFMLSSRYTFSGGFNITPFEEFSDSLRFQFSSYNTARLYDVYADFSYSLDYYLGRVGFTLNSYEFHTDFQDSMIRLRWGNINTELLSPAGTSIGIRFDKSLSYGGSNADKKSHLERILTIEKESDVRIINEGREIFRRTLQPGNYRLQDFILYTGANRIRIIVAPLDGSPVTETEIDISYANSLLAPGEIYFGGALATGRSIVSNDSLKPDGAIRLPWLNGTSFEYDARNLVLSGYIRAGLSETLTLDASLALQNRVSNDNPYQPASKLALEFTHANILGTTRYNLNITERSEHWGSFELPELYARVSHQVYTGWAPINAFSLSFTYDSNLALDASEHSLMFSLNTSGSINKFSWGLGTSLTLNTNDIDSPRYYASASLSYSLARDFYISANMSVSGYGMGTPSLSGRISATFRFNPGRASVSVSESRTEVSLGIDEGRHSFSAEIGVPTADFLLPEAYVAEADYSYSGEYINFDIGAQADNLFGSSSLDFSLSTSSVFADGLFSFSSGIPSNFILIKQEGALKGNEITIGAIGIAASDAIPMTMNTGLYTGISLNRASSLSIFSVNNESFGSSTSFDISIPDSQRSGYALRISAESRYSVSGVVVMPDGVPYGNMSSPVYRIVREDNSIETISSDYYIFTDSDGRFTLSDLEPGEYGFDVLTEEGWILYTFMVEEAPGHELDIYVYGSSVKDDSGYLPDPYTAMYIFQPGTYMTGDEFWSYIYPPMDYEEAV